MAFDRNNNFYLVSSQHNANDQTGAVVLERFAFSSTAPAIATIGAPVNSTNNVIYEWDSRNATNLTPAAVLSLSLAVDNNVSSFTDGTTGWTVSDPSSGNVYVAMGLNTPTPSGATNFNNFTAQLQFSKNQGAQFSAPFVLGAAGRQQYHASMMPRHKWSSAREGRA